MGNDPYLVLKRACFSFNKKGQKWLKTIRSLVHDHSFLEYFSWRECCTINLLASSGNESVVPIHQAWGTLESTHNVRIHTLFVANDFTFPLAIIVCLWSCQPRESLFGRLDCSVRSTGDYYLITSLTRKTKRGNFLSNWNRFEILYLLYYYLQRKQECNKYWLKKKSLSSMRLFFLYSLY